MKSYDGYLKKKLGDSYVHLTDGSHKSLGDFLGSIQYDSSNKKIQYKASNANSWSDLLTFGSNAFNSTEFVTIATTQTITGQKTFSNAKTIIGSKSTYTQQSDRGTVHHEFIGDDANYGVMKIRHLDTDGEGSPGSYSATLSVIDERNVALSGSYQPTFYINRLGTTTTPDLMGINTPNGRVFTVKNTGIVWSQGFSKNGATDSDILLGAGGHKALTDLFTDLSKPSNTNNISITVGGTTKTITLGARAWDDTAYLPLTGGTLNSSSTRTVLSIKSTSSSGPEVRFYKGDTFLSRICTNESYIAFVLSNSKEIGLLNNDPVYSPNGSTYYKIWHENNDGSDSGLDADLLDGQHGSYYVKRPGDDMYGTLVIRKHSGNTSITSALDALIIGTYNSRSTTSNVYYPGIAFNSMAGYESNTYSLLAPQGWIGLRLHSTPGTELSYLVFATKPGSGLSDSGNDRPIERLCISPTGNVGIGITNPSYLLQVNGESCFVDKAKTYIGGNALKINTTGDTKIAALGSGSSNPSSGGEYGILQLFHNGSETIRLYSAPNENSWISNGGKFGIGTTSPSSSLHVNGDSTLGSKSIYYQRSTRGAIHHDFIGNDCDWGVFRIRHLSTEGSGGPGSFSATLGIFDERSNNLSGTFQPTFYINRSGATRTPDLMGIDVGGTRVLKVTSSGATYTNGIHHLSHDNDDAVLLAGGGWKLESALSVSWANVSPALNTSSGIFRIHNACLMCNAAAGSTTITANLDAMLIGPRSTRIGTAGYYYPGIAFHMLLNYNGAGKDHNTNSPQAWIGTKCHSTSGTELAYLVFATKEASSEGSRPVERMNIAPNGRVTILGDCYASNFYISSDRNKKTNISLLSEHIRKFQLKDTKKWHYGVIAQEVPEMFRDGEEGNMTVNYNSVLSYYIGQLENKVKDLEEKVRQLENINK